MIRSKNWARNASSFIVCILKCSFPSSFVVQHEKRKAKQICWKINDEK